MLPPPNEQDSQTVPGPAPPLPASTANRIYSAHLESFSKGLWPEASLFYAAFTHSVLAPPDLCDGFVILPLAPRWQCHPTRVWGQVWAHLSPNKHCSSWIQGFEDTKRHWLLPFNLQGSPGILAPAVQALVCLDCHAPVPHSRESPLLLIPDPSPSPPPWPSLPSPPHSTAQHSPQAGTKSPLFTITATQVHKGGSNYPSTNRDSDADGFLSPNLRPRSPCTEDPPLPLR